MYAKRQWSLRSQQNPLESIHTDHGPAHEIHQCFFGSLSSLLHCRGPEVNTGRSGRQVASLRSGIITGDARRSRTVRTIISGHVLTDMGAPEFVSWFQTRLVCTFQGHLLQMTNDSVVRATNSVLVHLANHQWRATCSICESQHYLGVVVDIGEAGVVALGRARGGNVALGQRLDYKRGPCRGRCHHLAILTMQMFGADRLRVDATVQSD